MEIGADERKAFFHAGVRRRRFGPVARNIQAIPRRRAEAIRITGGTRVGVAVFYRSVAKDGAQMRPDSFWPKVSHDAVEESEVVGSGDLIDWLTDICPHRGHAGAWY